MREGLFPSRGRPDRGASMRRSFPSRGHPDRGETVPADRVANQQNPVRDAGCWLEQNQPLARGRFRVAAVSIEASP